ncbi:acyltransferase family protein [Aureimonas pseudogalii]|uniref:Peptidoglycan/LPS O-acetylase OafA/YrhL n=1 Tax=Aureimonas pseudogalii TaxID=1744844 RepID=A0A7W6H499_9HYPH|nr:acyltransferase [Aureimonas pseudogalii]MBB3997982.1 peptidoglycan/LPS O-acetylase OafA/YrhL [Aureimonas pseudogalii]
MHGNDDKRFRPLDGLRGVAVLAVLTYHTAAIPEAGRVGVDLFFVLSGFLITDIIAAGHARGAPFFAHFYQRRIIRLYPALLAACLLLAVITGIFPWLDQTTFISIVASLTMVSNYTQALGYGFPMAFGHTWTLATEWQFYLVWPLVYFGVRSFTQRETSLLAVLGAGVLAVWLVRYETMGSMWSWRSLDARGDGLLYGCILSIALRARPSLQIPKIVLLVAVCGFVAIAFLPVQGELYASNLLAALVVWGVVTSRSTLLNRSLSVEWLVETGRISYGLYLYHFPIAALCFVGGLSPWSNLVVTFAFSVPLAILSWHLMERPLLQMKLRPRLAVAA